MLWLLNEMIRSLLPDAYFYVQIFYCYLSKIQIIVLRSIYRAKYNHMKDN